MPSPFTFRLRHLWLLLGALLLTGGIVATIAWAAYKHPVIVAHYIGYEWADRLATRYVNTRLALPFVDRDGDQIPDWFETDFGTDPRLASSHPPLRIAKHPDHGIYAGQRTRLRWAWSIPGSWPHRWPAGFHAFVTADSPILLPLGADTPPTAGPMEASVSSDGYLSFDVIFNGPLTETHIYFRHPDPQVVFHAYSFGPNSRGALVEAYGWRDSRYPPPSVAVEMRTPPSPYQGSGFYRIPAPAPHLVWEPYPEPGIYYVLEVARADRPDQWIAVDDQPVPPASPTLVDVKYPASFPGYDGPLRYRLIPVRKQPPTHQPTNPPTHQHSNTPTLQPTKNQRRTKNQKPETKNPPSIPHAGIA